MHTANSCSSDTEFYNDTVVVYIYGGCRSGVSHSITPKHQNTELTNYISRIV
jgi:hypothetical protein